MKRFRQAKRHLQPDVNTTLYGNGCASITLSRVRSLNALTLPMVKTILRALKSWKTDPRVRFVLISGEGEKAFCAGGDIIGLARPAYPGFAADFFREEYTMNHLLSVFPKPVVSVMHGIVMGGGVGLSVHGTYRIITDNSLFAMPETGIGLLPDVGATHVLANHCPGSLGMLLGLNGDRLRVQDLLHARIGTHYCPVSQLESLTSALKTSETPLSELLDSFCSKTIDDTKLVSGFKTHAHLIDRCFSQPTLPQILLALSAIANTHPSVIEPVVTPSGSCAVHPAATKLASAPCLDTAEYVAKIVHPAALAISYTSKVSHPAVLQSTAVTYAGVQWARKTLKSLKRKSPTSMALAFYAIRFAQNKSLAQALQTEFRIVVRMTEAKLDFHEGVRAQVIDKDRKPVWVPLPPAVKLREYHAPFLADDHAEFAPLL